MSAKITIVAGLGYSDEGKGHVVQLLTTNDTFEYKEYDIVMRCNGSWSSSHQIDKNLQYKCFHLPSITKENMVLIVGQGMFVCPKVLIEELKQDFRKNQKIYISRECFVIEDNIITNYIGDEKIGTLGSGVRDTSIKKLNHKAKKLKDIVDKNNYSELSSYLIDDEEYFSLTNGKNILVEGSHGYLIDCNFGNYPYTTSTNTTPSGIMSLTKYSPKCCEKNIFVTGLILMSLSTHPEHKTFEHYNLGKIEELIPTNIKYDYACGKNMKRNLGPFNVNVINDIIKYYPDSDIYFTFFDIIDLLGIFYYIENDKLNIIEKNGCTDKFKSDIMNFLLSKFNVNILICPKPFER